MADEQKVETPDPGVSDNESANDDLASVDRAELERLQARDKTLTQIDEYAAEANIDGGAVSYVEALESLVHETPTASAATPEPEAPTSEEKPPAATPPPVGLSEADKQSIEEAKRTAMTAFLSSQASEWQRAQASLPEEERSPATADDLGKLIQKQPTAIKSLSTDRAYGGNVYAAANALYLTTSEGIRRTKEAAAASEKAKNDAASAATLSPGGQTATPSTSTEEEKQAAQMKAAADAIAPDDKPYEPPL
jgi:hypothetical protein